MSAKREDLINSSKLARLRRVAGGGARGPSKSLARHQKQKETGTCPVSFRQVWFQLTYCLRRPRRLGVMGAGL